MTTLAPIRRRSTRVELTQRELQLLDAFLFAGLVRIMQDEKQFDPESPEDDQFRMEFRMDCDIIRGIQRKMEFAHKQIQMEAAQ